MFLWWFMSTPYILGTALEPLHKIAQNMSEWFLHRANGFSRCDKCLLYKHDDLSPSTL